MKEFALQNNLGSFFIIWDLCSTFNFFGLKKNFALCLLKSSDYYVARAHEPDPDPLGYATGQ